MSAVFQGPQTGNVLGSVRPDTLEATRPRQPTMPSPRDISHGRLPPIAPPQSTGYTHPTQKNPLQNQGFLESLSQMTALDITPGGHTNNAVGNTNCFRSSHSQSRNRTMHLAKKILISYLKGIDATIRVLGAYIIIGILFYAIFGLCWLVARLPFIDIGADYLAGAVGLILLPLIMRLGVLGAGLSIPPIFTAKQKK